MQKKILVIEDDFVIRTAMSKRLSIDGFQVIEAEDGAQGLIRFNSENPDLILLDLIMPIKNGFEVLEEIKGRQKSKIPILVISNSDEAQKAKTAMKLGAAGYFVKAKTPLTDLVNKIDQLLQRS